MARVVLVRLTFWCVLHGDHIFAAQPAQFFLYNFTLTPYGLISTVVNLHGCQQHPCQPGLSCSYTNCVGCVGG